MHAFHASPHPHTRPLLTHTTHSWITPVPLPTHPAQDDTLVPIAAMREQLRLASPLYDAAGLTLGFVRLVNDSSRR